MEYAEHNLNINEDNAKQIDDMKKELSILNKKLQKATTERNMIEEQVNSNAKRLRNADPNDDQQTIVIMGMVKQMIDSSNKAMETLIKNSEERNNEQIKLLTAALTGFEKRLGNSNEVKLSPVEEQPRQVGVPNVVKKSESVMFTEVQYGLNQVRSSLKITFDNSNKENYENVILPEYRNDTTIRTFNLISVAENNNQFVLTFKSKVDRNSAYVHIREKFGNFVKYEKPKEFIPSIKIVGLYARDVDITDLQKMIIESNPVLELSEDNFTIIQIYSNGIQKGVNAIAEVTIDRFKIIMALGSLLVNTKNCRVYENLELLHCGKCQKFGHIKKFCESTVFICGNCAANHETKDCKNREKLKCINCANLNNTSIKTNHYTSSPLCRVRKERISGIKKFLKLKLDSIQATNNNVAVEIPIEEE